jgi:predicted O-linked N-acetylglucosamine transferase (SPINDLY family)
MTRLDEAIALHRGGRLDQAARAYEAMLEEDPSNADALHLLAIVRMDQGKLDDAESLARRAIGIEGRAAIYHATLAGILREKGEHAQAVIESERAVELGPERGEIWNNHGVTLERASRKDEAILAYQRAIAIDPSLVFAHVNLGRTFRDMEKFAEALGEYMIAIALDPSCAAARCGLAALLAQKGQPQAALEHWEAVLAAHPDHREALVDSALVLGSMGRLDEAEQRVSRALELFPTWAPAQSALGHVLMMRGRRDRAVEAFAKAAHYAPHEPRFAVRAAAALVMTGAVREGRAALEQCRARAPDDPVVHESLAQAYLLEGQIARAIASAERAVEIAPKRLDAQSFLLGVAHADPRYSPEKLFEMATTWGKLAAARNPRMAPARPDRDPDRRLKIGYVSGDFRMHPVGYALEALLPHHDKRAFEIVCYANQDVEDEQTRLLQRTGVTWRRVRALGSEALATLVREDEIDILVDLSGHTHGNRLEAFARKPAPVQATWLGYYATTGVAAMDWIICDERVLPESEQQWFVERPMRLPGCWVCIPRLRIPVHPAPLPALRQGLTFGCFNNLVKLGDGVLDTWARILEAVPNSRLVLKTHFLTEEEGRRITLSRFRARGVREERIVLFGWTPRIDTLRVYQEIDIALDPFPYSGGTTTLEALWMGVPVVAKRGTSFVSHICESILCAAGLEQLVAKDEDDYVRKATELAGDLDRLSAMRATLRDQLLSSELADGKRFARKLEAAFRKMWKQYLKETQ